MHHTMFMNTCQCKNHRTHNRQRFGHRQPSTLTFYICIKRLPLHKIHDKICRIIFLNKCIDVNHTRLFSQDSQHPAFFDILLFHPLECRTLFTFARVNIRISGIPVTVSAHIKFFNCNLSLQFHIKAQICDSKSAISKHPVNIIFVLFQIRSRR